MSDNIRNSRLMFGYASKRYLAVFSKSAFHSEYVRIAAEDFVTARREAARYLLRNEPIGKRDPQRVAIIDCKAAGWL